MSAAAFIPVTPDTQARFFARMDELNLSADEFVTRLLTLEAGDPFPLLEETREGVGLPTVTEWLRGGSPMREIKP